MSLVKSIKTPKNADFTLSGLSEKSYDNLEDKPDLSEYPEMNSDNKDFYTMGNREDSFASGGYYYQNIEKQSFFNFTNYATKTGMRIYLLLDMPFKLGNKTLHIDQLKITVFDADANNYLDAVTIKKIPISTSADNNIFANGINRTANGAYTYNFTKQTCDSNYVYVVQLDITCNTQYAFDCYVQMRYWYE